MCEILLLMGLALANDQSGDSVVIDNNRVFTRERRTVSGTPFLQTIPYVNRLFRTVGYMRIPCTVAGAIVGGAAAHEDLQTPAETAEFPAEEQSLPLPVLPALKPEQTPTSEPPDQTEILRALPTAVRLPYVLETYRDDVEFRTEKVADKIDPVRFYPFVGPAQLHHVHWKCIVSFTETTETPYPFKIVIKRRRQEVVYLDKDRLYLAAEKCERLQPLGGVCHGDASVKAQPCSPIRVRACWNSQAETCNDVMHAGTRVNVLKGTVYLFERASSANVAMNGRVTVTAVNQRGQKLAMWHFDPETLAKLGRRDMIGVGYTLCLPLDDNCLTAGEIRLNVAYHSVCGGVCCDESNCVNLRRDVIVRAMADERNGRVVQAMRVARSVESEPRRLTEVVRASHDIRGAAQVECSLIVAEVNLAKLDLFRLALSEDGKARIAVADSVHGTLRQLVASRDASIVAEPRILTLSGRPAFFRTGDDAADKVLINLLPIVHGDAVTLELHSEIVDAQAKRGTGVARKVPAGCTLVMAFPDARRDKCLVVLATPTIVQPTPVIEPARKQMTFSEVIAMSRHGIAADIIVRQMDVTETVFRLSVEDIIHLHNEGVSDAVIRAMQERCTPSPRETPVRRSL